MALKIGSLFVSLTANTDGFAKSMSKAMKDVEKFSREVKKAANDAAQVAGSITALGAAALKLGADVSGPAKAAMTEFQASIKQAAAPVAEALVPAVREAAGIIRGLGKTFAELSPETKATIAEVFKVAAAVTAASLVIGRLAALVQLAAGVMSGLAGAIAAVGVGPLLAVLAVVAGLAAGIAVLHKAWRENWGGIQQVVGSVAQWFADTWDGALNFVRGAFSAFVDSLAGLAKASLGILAQLADATGTGAGPAIRASMNVVDQVAKDMKSGASVKKFVVAALDLGKAAGTAFLDEWKMVFKELGLDFEKFAGKLKAMQEGAPLTGKRKPTQPTLDKNWYEKEFGEGNLRDLGEKTRAAGQSTRISQTTPVAGKAAQTNFTKLTTDQVAAAKAAADATKTGLMGVAQTMIGRLGTLGGIINDTITAAQTGGPWAALATAVSGVLMETEGFAELARQAQGALKDLVSAIEPLATGMFQAVGRTLAGAMEIVKGAFQLLAPAFKALGAVLDPLAPVLFVLGQIIGSLAPVIEAVVNVVLAPLQILKPLLGVVYGILVALGAGLLWLVNAIGGIWNSIVNAVADAITTVIKFITGGLVTTGGDFLRGLTVDLKGTTKAYEDMLKQGKAILDNPIDTLSGKTQQEMMEEIRKRQAMNDSIDQTKDTIDAVNEAFLNIPTGFKVAAARFGADASGYTPSTLGSGGVINVGGVVIYANDSEEALDQLEEMMTRRVFRSTGSPLRSNIGNLR